LGQVIGVNALNNWETSVNEYLADLQAGIEELTMPLLKHQRSGIKYFAIDFDYL
jgi:hypothetical protein